MADYYYAILRGESMTPQNVDVGTTTFSEDIELHVSTTNSPTKLDVILALKAFEQYILSHGVGTAVNDGTDIPAG